ncbi:MAG: hypothetical protein RR288_06780 [Oscillibacter sp.]
MQVFLAVTPKELSAAGRFTQSFAQVAYRVGPESSLLRQDLLLQSRGGVLSVSDRDAPPIDAPETLCAAVLRECGRRSYTGVLLDFESPPTADRLRFAEQLDGLLSRNRKALYVPEGYARVTAAAAVLVGTAISGGNFEDYLREAVARRGPARTALDVERLRMDFRLPARTGQGRSLTALELAQLTEELQPSIFFSQVLCTRYFTYTREGEAHFVLFDDGDTLSRKLRLGTALGISAAFLMYPEVEDALPKLFPPQSGKG